MKQFTNSEQTAKLIQLGFEHPKSIEKMVPQGVIDGIIHLIPQRAYSVGELIEILPSSLLCGNDVCWSLSMEPDVYSSGEWSVCYAPSYCTEAVELIDALFDMVIKLKKDKRL